MFPREEVGVQSWQIRSSSLRLTSKSPEKSQVSYWALLSRYFTHYVKARGHKLPHLLMYLVVFWVPKETGRNKASMKRNLITGEMCTSIDQFKNATNLIFKGAQCYLHYFKRTLRCLAVRMITSFYAKRCRAHLVGCSPHKQWNVIVLFYYLGIGTQGQVTDDRWVMSYGITYSANGLKWTNYTEDNRQKVT